VLLEKLGALCVVGIHFVTMSVAPQNLSVALSKARGSNDTTITAQGMAIRPDANVTQNNYQSAGSFPSFPSGFEVDENWSSENQLPLSQPRVNFTYALYPVALQGRPTTASIGVGMPLFIRLELPKSISSRKRIIGGVTRMIDAHVLLTPPHINELLMMDATNKIDDPILPEDFMKLWSFAGISSTDRTDKTGGPTHHMVVDRIHSTTVCNIWGPVRGGQCLWLAVVYYPLQDRPQYFRGSFDDAVPRMYPPMNRKAKKITHCTRIVPVVTFGHEPPSSQCLDTYVLQPDGSKKLVRGFFFKVGFVKINPIYSDINDMSVELNSYDLPYADGLVDIQQMVRREGCQVYVHADTPIFQ